MCTLYETEVITQRWVKQTVGMQWKTLAKHLAMLNILVLLMCFSLGLINCAQDVQISYLWISINPEKDWMQEPEDGLLICICSIGVMHSETFFAPLSHFLILYWRLIAHMSEDLLWTLSSIALRVDVVLSDTDFE